MHPFCFSQLESMFNLVWFVKSFWFPSLFTLLWEVIKKNMKSFLLPKSPPLLPSFVRLGQISWLTPSMVERKITFVYFVGIWRYFIGKKVPITSRPEQNHIAHYPQSVKSAGPKLSWNFMAIYCHIF